MAAVNSLTDPYVRWVYEWMARRSTIPEAFDIEHGNYFDAKIIDSFAIIELIEAAEGQFGIRFTELHFQDRRFSTIGGLAAVIQSLSE